jgi:maleate isomerase
MTTDSLGYRKKFGVIAPSTNTSVQPEFGWMAPHGVTNHFSRIVIPDDPVHTDEDFDQLMKNIRGTMMESIDAVMTCSPDALVMGMSSETFWDGLDGSLLLRKRVEERAKVPVVMGSDACQAAMRLYGDIKRISVITPYMPIGDNMVRRFFNDVGFEIVNLIGLKCTSPMLISHVTEKELRDAINEVNDPSVEAIIQVGTNLAMARLAGVAEFWLDKPVLAINTCTYWHALRTNGIMDKVHGFGSLLWEH